MMKPVTEQELKIFLSEFSEWKLIDNNSKIERVFPLKSYFKGLSFIQCIGWVAQKKNHHPELELQFSQIKIKLQTHDIGNQVSILDLEFAKEIEKLWF